MSEQESNLLKAAIVAAARGLRGEVSLNVRTDRPEECFYPGAEFSTDSEEFPTLTLESVNFNSGKTLVYFAQVATREQAEAIRGILLLVEEMTEDDAWYAHELTGLSVRDLQGNNLGVVIDLLPGAAQDILVVEYQGRSVWVPFVEELVPTVDIKGGQVIVDPPAGLFDDESLAG